jgi:hypothetical protein
MGKLRFTEVGQHAHYQSALRKEDVLTMLRAKLEPTAGR